MPNAKNDLANNLFISLGIVHQLTDSFLMRHLGQFGLSISQFNVLSHFARHSEKAVTVSELTRVMQMNQPAVTKIVNKLYEMELVEIQKDSNDGRKKWVNINQNGLKKVSEAYMRFQPFMAEVFAEWEEDEMQETLAKVNKLKTWLDNNRGL
ncbi:MarR family winged helix-turn-helix transcriptional regulator [Thaumasiovibrio subtropicus]|uniref:MarR family winged helix-turn-helix transcriptional regulator n=1 Tax=Thaumasiovibrio subtropicus TaxID=1891207 RepID=UPI000B35A030|nr:MarR family transcriptional regulator [Thaumasiovibrio subtropicus]